MRCSKCNRIMYQVTAGGDWCASCDVVTEDSSTAIRWLIRYHFYDWQQGNHSADPSCVGIGAGIDIARQCVTPAEFENLRQEGIEAADRVLHECQYPEWLDEVYHDR